MGSCFANVVSLTLSALLLLGCGKPVTEIPQDEEGISADSQIINEELSVAAKSYASVKPTSIDAINKLLRPHDRVFLPKGDGPFPTMLFLHGCSGPTTSHEDDWAAFYNDIGVAVIAINSFAGRGTQWEDACSLKAMTAWERAGDILATLEYVRTLDFVDNENLGVTGFSHGAWTIWEALVFATNKTPPTYLDTWPQHGVDGLKLALPFYGGCYGRWSLPVKTISFLGDSDKYIDESTCVEFANENPDLSKFFSYRIFNGATHTFDHANPNPSNIAAGSIYDEASTAEARRMIAEAVDLYMR